MDEKPSPNVVAEFVRHWETSEANERANYALFLTELCDLLELPHPKPAGGGVADYIFERPVTFNHGDGTTSIGRIDLYKRDCFVLEAKQGSNPNDPTAQPDLLGDKPRRKATGHGVRGTLKWHQAMEAARAQAERYAKALPVEEGWPPFIVVLDVGHSFALYADFSGSGKAYVPFPDPQSHRIALDTLADPEVRETLVKVWTDPTSLDPSRVTAEVTQRVAERLARLARSLELAGRAPDSVAQFLMRCLFTMFAEDVGLLPEGLE